MAHHAPFSRRPVNVVTAALMLALAGLPGTAGFIGKLFLIEAAVDGDYTWLGVAIVIGTMVSLAYYLRIIAAIWMRPSPDYSAAQIPAMAGGAPEPDRAEPDEKRIGWVQAIRAADRADSANPRRPQTDAGSDSPIKHFSFFKT